ncbi:MAG: transcription-repair coupling factor [Alphaproteobacteria bacterium]|nr:transcription-repair coupling factor [Alphaproteobacteria bacterium]
MSQQGPALKPDSAERHTLAGVPEGYDSVFLAKTAREHARKSLPVIHVAADDLRYEEIAEALAFFGPDVEVLRFPAWDCLPYDRISPTAEVVGERLKTLSRLLHRSGDAPCVVVTTVSAVTQRIPPRELLRGAVFSAKVGEELDQKALTSFLVANGYHRTETVREAGEYALRGGLIDIFPSGAHEPLRIDCFGDEIEHIRAFDALSQRTTENRGEIALYPVCEVLLTEENIAAFRAKYREIFGAIREEDPLYESIGEGRRHAGMEHWLPLYYGQLETLLDYAPGAAITLDHQAEQARQARWQQVDDLYQARRVMLEAEQAQHLAARGKKEKARESHQVAAYRPVPLPMLYVPEEEWRQSLGGHEVIDLSPFAPAPGQADAGARKGRDFGDVRAQSGADIYGAIKDHVQALAKAGGKILLAAYSNGARERLRALLEQQGLRIGADAQDVNELQPGLPAMAVLGLEKGFSAPGLAVLTEQDMLGDRLSRISKKKKKSDAFMFEISQLHEGDYVVHEEHGIGRFERLETVVVDNVPHDCLKLIYAGGDKLFVPVEHLDVLSRYGAAEAGAVLDRLGGSAWQARKARVKRDLLALANELLKVAALRVLRHTEPVHRDLAACEKFAAGFPYPETDDQQKAIEDVLEDLDKDQAMDRLVCGDVGFGKTEVALRAASVVALAGLQVAVIAPTTLLARQHYQTFSQRFHGFPVRIGLLSRFVTGKEAERTRQGVEKGDVDIIIGTHALLSEKIKFANLALLVVDEEQKFGVKQKEKIKQLKENLHVLTLTATPIPRTLQMALSGVRELSLITTAPIDRLAVKTFVLPYDPVVIRDALMREHYRGGQSFYVCPRISDLRELEEDLKQLVPELKVVVAHGQMGAEEMEEKMAAFYEGAFDVLLSTSIVESGLDIPNANTMIIHRSEMFGLAQLYQMRGRIGRAKQRAYAYLTFDPAKKLTKCAEQRLHAIEQLDSLGAGFQLASHDLDIRGAGNLLGEEQSGHIREIGVELYQQMLEEAVAAAREGVQEITAQDHWSPQINLGMAVVIPERYIPDLNLRLSIYRRIAALSDRQEIDAFAAELIDRFGPLPKDVENLLDLVEIKQLCRHAGVDRVDAGPKGAVMSFHPSSKIDLLKLVKYIQEQTGTAKIRPDDQKLVFMRAWDDLPVRVRGIHKVLKELTALVA